MMLNFFKNKNEEINELMKINDKQKERIYDLNSDLNRIQQTAYEELNLMSDKIKNLYEIIEEYKESEEKTSKYYHMEMKKREKLEQRFLDTKIYETAIELIKNGKTQEVIIIEDEKKFYVVIDYKTYEIKKFEYMAIKELLKRKGE
jgi:hypothetical protein